MKKILIGFGLIVMAGVVGFLTYVRLALPNVGPALQMNVELTAERVARGEYLANHVTVCIDCHSARDWNLFAGPIAPGTVGRGGELFDQRYGFPGVYYSRNITPSGIKDWTDGELYRVITTGVARDGKAMFPVMPYPYYGRMDEEDIKSIIAYIRTLKPIENSVPVSHSDFPMSLIIRTIPKKAQPTKKPDPGDSVAYGKYLVNAAACRECHTQVERGQVIDSLEFSGGREFPLASGQIVRSSNITPERETGIGAMSRDTFVALFKNKAELTKAPSTLGYNAFMPWAMYGGMNKKDLGAIYDYLRTVKPIANSVVRFTNPH